MMSRTSCVKLTPSGRVSQLALDSEDSAPHNATTSAFRRKLDQRGYHSGGEKNSTVSYTKYTQKKEMQKYNN